MAKIDVELVKQVLVRNNLDSSKIKEILEDISYEVKVSQQEKGEKEPAVNKQFVFV